MRFAWTTFNPDTMPKLFLRVNMSSTFHASRKFPILFGNTHKLHNVGERGGKGGTAWNGKVGPHEDTLRDMLLEERLSTLFNCTSPPLLGCSVEGKHGEGARESKRARARRRVCDEECECACECERSITFFLQISHAHFHIFFTPSCLSHGLALALAHATQST